MVKKISYTNIAIPDDLIFAAEYVVENMSFLGYRNRSEFCVEAVRSRLRELGVFERRDFQDEYRRWVKEVQGIR